LESFSISIVLKVKGDLLKQFEERKMKIRTNSAHKPLKLGKGQHQVTMSRVYIGKTLKGVSYLNIKFENDNGYLFEKFYLQEDMLSTKLEKLFHAAGIDTKNSEFVDSRYLEGKSLTLTLDSFSYVNPKTGVISDEIRIADLQSKVKPLSPSYFNYEKNYVKYF
jgi:hypothetical protein